MFKLSKPIFFHVLTPLHVGSGSDLGIVDMPIQREKHTGFPKIESSSLKGSIREAFEDLNEKKFIEEKDEKKYYRYELSNDFKNKLKRLNNPIVDEYEKEWQKKEIGKEVHLLNKYNQAIELSFGPEESGDSGYAGALGFTDARLLLFPVKSIKNVFAWVTCPEVLEKFKSEMDLCGIQDGLASIDFKKLEYSTHNDSKLFIKDNNIIILEEYAFTIKNEENNGCSKIVEWLQNNLNVPNLKEKLVILNKEDFKDFVNLSTEVITRTKIDNITGTVKSGGLFTEEYLPAESILYSLVFSSPIFQPDEKKGIFKQNGKKEEDLVMEFFENIPKIIQIGGNASLGKGIVEVKKFNPKGNGGENGNK